MQIIMKDLERIISNTIILVRGTPHSESLSFSKKLHRSYKFSNTFILNAKSVSM